MSQIVAHVLCKPKCEVWEVWSDGKAYSDQEGNPVLYRWQDAGWRKSLVVRMPPAEQSQKLEEAFQTYLSKIIVGPVDPLRHLRRR